jgi:hypothetical protein
VDDQSFAGIHLQSRRRIEIAARHLPVGCGAANHFIVEKQKVLDRLGYRIERGLALSRREPNFKNAFLARQCWRLSELRSNRGFCSSLGSLGPGSRAGTFKLHQESHGADCKQADQATCVEHVLE